MKAWALMVVAGLAVVVSVSPALGWGRDDEEASGLVSGALKAKLEAGYLKDGERAALRVRHGLASGEDIKLPGARAKVALQRGVFDDEALVGASAVGADPLDRAEAALRRGEVGLMLKGLDALRVDGEKEPARAVRLRAEGLELIGRYELARRVGSEAVARLAARTDQTSADEIVELVRATAVLLRHGPERGGEGAQAAEGVAADFEQMMNLLAEARRRDPLSFSARFVEAELLFDKDNYAQAGQALQEAMKLNPSSAEIWGLMGELAVNTFDLSMSAKVAQRLDALAVLPGLEGKDEAEASVVGAVVRGRAALRQDDWTGAVEALKKSVSRMSSAAGLRRGMVAAVAVSFDEQKTRALLDEYDAWAAEQGRLAGLEGEDGKPAEANAAAGRALSDSRRYERASAYLNEAARRSPTWSVPRAELGLLHMQSGRDEEALGALRAVERLDPFNVRAANSLKLLRSMVGFERVEGERFVIRAKPGLDVMLAREMLPALEASGVIVTGDGPGGLRHSPMKATVIDLMPNHAQFAVRIAGMPRIHTIAASTGPVIAMESPRTGAGHSGTYDWDRVLRHEYAHTVGLSRTGNRIPHWFTEAQAVYLERAPRDYSTVQLLTRVMINDDLLGMDEISLAFTRPKRPTDRQLAYAQGHWMMEYMIGKHGAESPLVLMDTYAKGASEEEAFVKALGVGREEFFARFQDWAAGELIAWGMDIPKGTLTVEKLLEMEKEKRKGESVEPTVEMVDGWLKAYPEHPDVLELAVVLRTRDGAKVTAEMKPLLERYARARPVDPMPRKLLAGLALEAGDDAGAAEHLEYLDIREEKSATYAAELARVYMRMGDMEKAWVKATRATRVGPYEAGMRELAATVALRRKDYAGARGHLAFLAALEPGVEKHKQRLAALERLISEGR